MLAITLLKNLKNNLFEIIHYYHTIAFHFFL